MVPSLFVTLESLPLTPNGKVDRGALSVPDRTDQESEDPNLAPQSHFESLIGDIWKELLDIKAVSVSDKFLNLGGDSILAIRLMNKLEERIGLRITFSELMLLNLGELARYCEEGLKNHEQGEI